MVQAWPVMAFHVRKFSWTEEDLLVDKATLCATKWQYIKKRHEFCFIFLAYILTLSLPSGWRWEFHELKQNMLENNKYLRRISQQIYQYLLDCADSIAKSLHEFFIFLQQTHSK